MKIFIISDNKWVKESVEKYLSFKNVIETSSEIEDVKDAYDYIFVDMQVKSNGGPSLIRELKRSDFTNLGDRIAQLILERAETPEVKVEEHLDETLRGSGGFGSTDNCAAVCREPGLQAELETWTRRDANTKQFTTTAMIDGSPGGRVRRSTNGSRGQAHHLSRK